MAMSCTFPLSRSAFAAIAVVAVSILVFTNFHPGDSNVLTGSAAEQSEFTDGADTMVAMQGDINVKSGPKGKCSRNSKSATCQGMSGQSDSIVALQSTLQLELEQEGEEDKEHADSDTIVASQGKVHFQQADDEDEDDKEAADVQEGENHNMNAVEGDAESLSLGPQFQEEKGKVTDSIAVSPSSLLANEGADEVADDKADVEADDHDDKLSATNAALSLVTDDRSFDNAKVAHAVAPSDEGLPLARFAVNEIKTSNTAGMVEHGKSDISSLNASGEDVDAMMQENQHERAGLDNGASTFTESIRKMVADQAQMLGIGSGHGLAIGLMVLLLMCTCVGGMTLAYPSMMPFAGDASTLEHQKPSPGTDQRQAMMERWPAQISNGAAGQASAGSILAPWPGQARHSEHHSGDNHDSGYASGGHASGRNSTRPSTKPSLPVSGPLGGVSLSKAGSQATVGAVSMSRPMSQLFMSQPQSQISLAQTQEVPSKIKMTGASPWASQSCDRNTDPRAGLRGHQSPEQEEEEVPPGLLPPPLCPMLVMPTCEARFGVPMFELAEVNGEGEVTIVGLSGAPLLRGIVRKIGHLRSLEIAMNESNSAPRATITPSMMELAGSAPRGKGAKALEIRGVRGSFYGTLEMAARMDGGTCSVIKDGATVLRVDGNAENLRLSIKSGNGTRLASVCCSSEAFGGIDHIEIRVQKGVDTVLVLAVVLAVLLLSPYLHAQEPPMSQ